MPEPTSKLYIVTAIESFSEAINAQNQYAESQGILWDRFGSMAAYVFSSYGIATFLVAVILNRTMLLAATTNPVGRPAVVNNGLVHLLRRRYKTQALVLGLLRILLLYFLCLRARDIFVALSVVALNDKPGAVCRFVRLTTQYFHYDPVSYANNRFMRMLRSEVRFGPTSSMLWPVFVSVCYSLFVETFSAAILNTKPLLEGGISLFELSLAVQEMSSGFFFLREYSVAKRPSEQVLIVCLFLICDQICNQLNSFLFHNKHRLISLTVINLSFISYFISNVLSGRLLKFPLNITITYLSLIFIVWISLICLSILALALLTKGFDLSELNFTNCFADDHRDHEFFTQHLGINQSQDFHVAVLNLGIFAVTLAGKSSYITEYSYIPVPQRTWLEANMYTRVKLIVNSLSGLVKSEDVLNEKILSCIADDFTEGYAKIIADPTSQALSGFELKTDAKPVSVVKLRVKYLMEIFMRVTQLSFCYFKTSILIALKWLGYDTLEVPERPKFLHQLDNNHFGEISNSLGKSRGPKDVHFQDVFLKEDDDEELDLDYVAEDSEDGEDDVNESEIEYELVNSNAYTDTEETPLSELISAEGFIELLENQDLIAQRWKFRKQNEGMMTRSRFKRFSMQNPAFCRNSENLLDLILSIRGDAQAENQFTKRHISSTDEENIVDSRIVCVICHSNPREIIMWPCKCFAICEDCRIRLVAQNLEGCVCCRRDVEGVSRIFLP